MSSAARGGVLESYDLSHSTYPSITAPQSGVALSPAGFGESGNNAENLYGGEAAVGLSDFQARQLRYPGVLAGGAGAGGFGPNQNWGGGSGGGSLVILCKEGIVNNDSGLISANGASSLYAGGGGAGGIILLASPGFVTNEGVLQAKGAKGGNSRADQGAGGGGGGGIVHLISPNVTAGTIQISAGAAGGTATEVTSSPRVAGGSGGACGGRGGYGRNVLAGTNSQTSSGDATSGHSLISTIDPTALF